MIALDVNVLVLAFRQDAPGHAAVRRWLAAALAGDEPVGLADAVLSGFLRVVTHPRVFDPPAPFGAALRFAETVRSARPALRLEPGPRHWEIFTRLCAETGAAGNLVPDAWLAALAIESGADWVTTDRDYDRFRGLRTRRPAA